MARIYDSADYEREYKLSRSAAKVYKYLCGLIYMSRQGGKYRDGDGYYAYVKRTTIAAHIGRSESTAARALAELKRTGLIRVKRTKKFARIYLYSTAAHTANDTSTSGKNDTSTSGKNDTSNNKSKSIENMINTSINLSKTDTHDRLTETRKKDRTKTQATPKQRQRIADAEKRAARRRYKDHLETRLGLNDRGWSIFPDEWERLNALADVIADAVSVKNGYIKVNGCHLTVDQYWNMVRYIEYSESIQGLFDRIKTANVCAKVTNLRAYTLAAVYNAVQWDRCTRGAEVSTKTLYSYMA